MNIVDIAVLVLWAGLGFLLCFLALTGRGSDR